MEKTIFVSIASYRDDRCSDTLKSLFQKAEFPQRVFVGLCEQNVLDSKKNEDCVSWDDPFFRSFYRHIRRIELPSNDAAGPCYARYLCSLLYRGEDYFLQIDSHTMFVKNWDTKCITLLNECRQPAMSLLSYYPIPADQYKDDPPPDTHIPVISDWFLNSKEILQWKPGVYTPMNNQNKESPFLAGGFIFGPGHFILDVPFDPFLPYLFMGEESLLTIRAYTSGYDIFTPRLSIVYHKYHRSDQPSIYRDIDHSRQMGLDKAMKRCRLISGITWLQSGRQQKDFPPLRPQSSYDIVSISSSTSEQDEFTWDNYGIGTMRPLVTYFETIGLDEDTLKKQSKEHFVLFPRVTTCFPLCVTSVVLLGVVLMYAVLTLSILYSNRHVKRKAVGFG